MEETKKTTVPPGSGTPAAAGSPGTGSGTAAAEAAVPPKKKRGPSPGTEKDQTGGKGRARKSTDDLKFEAIKALSNLGEDGKFFLLYETPEGEKNIVHCWS